jgi:hypothetical protein
LESGELVTVSWSDTLLHTCTFLQSFPYLQLFRRCRRHTRPEGTVIVVVPRRCCSKTSRPCVRARRSALTTASPIVAIAPRTASRYQRSALAWSPHAMQHVTSPAFSARSIATYSRSTCTWWHRCPAWHLPCWYRQHTLRSLRRCPCARSHSCRPFVSSVISIGMRNLPACDTGSISGISKTEASVEL